VSPWSLASAGRMPACAVVSRRRSRSAGLRRSAAYSDVPDRGSRRRGTPSVRPCRRTGSHRSRRDAGRARRRSRPSREWRCAGRSRTASVARSCGAGR
jgi:hypothetical protein